MGTVLIVLVAVLVLIAVAVTAAALRNGVTDDETAATELSARVARQRRRIRETQVRQVR